MEPVDDSILDDFLVDSHEGLDRLDRDLVQLERDPASVEAIASAFRALHTIKGTCSFLGLRRLEAVAHAGESLLARLRSGRLEPSAEIVESLLAVVDAVRAILNAIESTRSEPEGNDADVLARLAPWLAPGPREVAPLGATVPGVVPSGATVPEIATVSKPAPDAPAPATTGLRQQHLRVDVRRLDRIMDLVGELVLARNQLVRAVASDGAGPAARSATPARGAGASAGRAAQRVDSVTTQLQDEVMRARMQPVSELWARLPRLVRDVAATCGKRVRLEMAGNATELDRTIVEALKDPLTHLVRNAIDHGIEPPAARERAGKPPEGTLRLSAFQEGGSVHLILDDDGAGMSIARIREQALARGLVDAKRAKRFDDDDWLQLVFVPGFSTAAAVTSISGRGVGLDAARAAIEAVGGTIAATSEPGRGTTFHVRLPLTLAILPALTVEQSGECYAVPQAQLLELARLNEAGPRIEVAHDRPVVRLRGELVPVVLLGQVFNVGGAGALPRHLLLLASGGRRFGLAVDRVRDSEEIVVRPLHPRLRESGLFAGATVRGDGRVALILDVPSLAAHAGLDRDAAAAKASPEPARPPRRRVPLLLVRARSGVPAAVRVAEVERIVELESQAFERFGDRPAVRLGGEVLPITSLAGDPTLASPDSLRGERAWPVLIHARDGRRQGLVVDAVEDIVEWEGEGEEAGRTGSDRIVVRDRITDLVTLTASDPAAPAARRSAP